MLERGDVDVTLYSVSEFQKLIDDQHSWVLALLFSETVR